MPHFHPCLSAVHSDSRSWLSPLRGLVWIYGQRVVTAVILADLDEAWRPEEDIFRLGNFESRLRFPVCKLIDRLDSDWRDDHSLPVQVARAQIAALRTAGDSTGRYGAKWQLVRNLYDLGYNADEVREIFRMIDWMMSLPEDLSRKFEEELVVLEESLNMPYVTSVERIAEARGGSTGADKGWGSSFFGATHADLWSDARGPRTAAVPTVARKVGGTRRSPVGFPVAG